MAMTKEERKEKRREYAKKYKEKNKEKILERQRQYNENNKEREKERKREWYENNKEKIKEYHQTETGKKAMRISKWKQNGVECEDFNVLYDYYINCKECEECGIELTVDKRTTPTTRCLDHCHETNKFRNVLCNSCNVKRK